MSRSRTRARNRAARRESDRAAYLAQLRDRVELAKREDAESSAAGPSGPRERADHGRLWRLMQDLNREDHPVWDIAKAGGCTDDDKAMIAEAVAPGLRPRSFSLT